MDRGKTNVKTYMGYITTAIVVVAYILYGLIIPTDKGVSLLDIVINSAITFILGILLSNTLSQQGLLDGAKAEPYLSAKTQINLAYSKAKPYSHYINKFTAIKNKRATKEVMDSILDKYHLSHSDHFDDKGRFIQSSFFVIHESKQLTNKQKLENKENKKKNRVLQYLSSGLTITQITDDDVFAQDNATIRDPLKRARTETSFVRKQNTSLLFSKVITSLVGGAYGATFIGADVGTILFKILVATILVVMGFYSYLKHYKYKTVEAVSRLNQSALWLDEFYNMVQSGEIGADKEPEKENRDTLAHNTFDISVADRSNEERIEPSIASVEGITPHEPLEGVEQIQKNEEVLDEDSRS